MLRTVLVWVVTATLSCCVASAQATAGGEVPARRARTLRLLEVSHIREQTRNAFAAGATILRQTKPESAALISTEVWEALLNSMIAKRASIVEKYLSEDDVEGLIAFYETPLGQRYAEAETHVTSEMTKLYTEMRGLSSGKPAGTQSPAAGLAAPVHVGGEIKEPKKLKHVNPEYPQAAKEARVQGVVILECLINRDGTVGEMKLQQSVPMLDEAAKAAVGQWVYTPTLLNGVAVPVIMTVTVNFRLQ